MKLTQKELAALTAIDASEYGSLLTDAVWSFTIADNIPNSAGIARRAVPGIVASLQKKGYTRSGFSDGERTVEMTAAGAQAYTDAIGKRARKAISWDNKAQCEIWLDPTGMVAPVVEAAPVAPANKVTSPTATAYWDQAPVPAATETPEEKAAARELEASTDIAEVLSHGTPVIIALSNRMCRELSAAEEGAYDDALDVEPSGRIRDPRTHAHLVAKRDAEMGRLRILSLAEAADLYYAICSGTFQNSSAEAARAALLLAPKLRESARRVDPEMVRMWPGPRAK
jgi:hypothetical protein